MEDIAAQDSAELDTATITSIEARLTTLDSSSTDWVLLRDVCDKVSRLGAGAVPVVQKMVAAAREREDARYSLRLLGVLARLDHSGVVQLQALTKDKSSRVAAIAARMLGRCGVKTRAARTAFKKALMEEERPWIASAIAMGAADAGAVEAAPAILARLKDGQLPPRVAIWFAVALARLSKDTPVATVEEWLRSPTQLADVGTLAAR